MAPHSGSRVNEVEVCVHLMFFFAKKYERLIGVDIHTVDGFDANLFVPTSRYVCFEIH